MKKPSTYCFLAIAVLSMLIAAWIREATQTFSIAYAVILEGKTLPFATRLAISVPWWPYAFVSVAVLGLAVSLCTRLKSPALCLASFGLVLCELAITAFLILSFSVPLYVPMN